VPSDQELAAARLNGAAYAVALAVRVMRDRNEPTTIDALIAATGLSRSAIYDARATLRERWPDEYARSPETRTAALEADPPSRTPARLAGVRLVQPAAAPAAAIWQAALARQALEHDGKRSWDAYRDVYSPAWDAVLDLVPASDDPTPELIALASHYVERVTGEPIDRGPIAMLVRQYGKAALYGLSKAMGATDQSTMRDWYRYARAVAARTVQELGGNP
jgi:hypothetical protein